MTPSRPLAILASLVLVACGTGDAGPSDPADASDTGDAATEPDVSGWEPPPATLWPERPSMPLAGPFVDAHPAAFERLSGYVTQVEGPVAARPDVGHRGGYGTGNGHAFALFGMTDPLNTLHGLTTPTYERGERFFGDYALRLAPAGGELTHFDEEHAAWSLSAPVVLTRGRLGDLVLATYDFAPATSDPVLAACMIRVLELTAEGAATTAHDLHVVPTNSVEPEGDDGLVESNGERVLLTRFADAEATVDGSHLVLAVPALTADETASYTLVHCGAAGDTPPVVPPVDAGTLIDATVAAHAAWLEGLLRVELPDPLVADLVDGLAMALRVQISAQGATCPMSQYTRTWLRDNIGPVLALLQLGAHDEVAGMLDYVYGAAVLGGDYANSFDADLDVTNLPDAPDWDTLPPLKGKVAAETPSYVVWMYGAWEQHTGGTARAAERWGWLRRGMHALGFEDGLLPFSGDETFRAAMNAAFGLFVDYEHHALSFSSNSSLLWLGAEAHYTRLAGLLGHTADAEAAGTLRAEVEAAFLDTYVLADGCISALKDRATDAVWPDPFEDAALKLTWAGYQTGDEALAADATECLLDRLGVAPGRVQSPLHPDHIGSVLVPVEDPVYTGMLPGYTLAGLTATGHPEAEAAFDLLNTYVGTSGQLQEYQVASDDSGLTLIYDPSGTLTDYTAKFRPWEGGIVLDALLGYLVGFRPDATAGRVDLRPHLPNDWPSARYLGLRIGDDRLDVEVIATEAGFDVHVTSHAAGPLDVAVRCDDPAEPEVLEAGGELVVSCSGG